MIVSPHLKKSRCFCVGAAAEYLGVFGESGLITHVPNAHLGSAGAASLISELRYFGGTMFGDCV